MSSALTTATAAMSEAFDFLSLPEEIRRFVYLELLVSPLHPTDKPVARRDLVEAYTQSHSRYRSGDPSPPKQAASFLFPNILASCSFINNEASKILYKENHFCAHPSLLTGMPFFLYESRKLLTPQIVSRRAIRRWHLQVRLDCDPRFDAAKLKEAFDGADELSVAASEAMYRSSGLHNLLMFAEIRGVKKTSVTGSVDPRVAQWLERVMRCEEDTPVPSLEEWQSSAPVLFGGVFDDRAFVKDHARNYYNPWTHSNR